MVGTQAEPTARAQRHEPRPGTPEGDEARRRLIAEMPVTEHRLDLAGISTAVLEGGEGAPVVLLHGPMANATHWMRVVPGLAARHRVIVPDLPGHGATMPGAHDEIDRVIAHRLQREAKVIAALRRQGPGTTLDALVPEVYADTPVALHGLARHSLLAHLQKQAALSAAHALLGRPGGAPLDETETAALRDAVGRAAKPMQRYRCAACAFEAQHYFWQCPACLGWDTYPPLRLEDQ